MSQTSTLGTSHKVVFATISLHNMAGGLEKNIVRIANFLSARGYDAHICTFDIAPSTSFYPINANVTWHQLGQTPPHGKISFGQRLRLILNIRDALKSDDAQPTTLIVFHHGILLRFILASLFMNVRVLCSERNSLKLYDYILASKWNINFLMLALVKKIIVQFPNYIKDYPKPLQSKITVIPNIVEPATQTSIGDTKTRYTILSVGRLCAQKNFELIIESFAKIAPSHPDWDLKIIGEGASRAKLEQLIVSLGLQSRVFLPGKSSDMASYYADTDIFCTASQWEGFPNALAEVMAHGIPPIGLHECAGVSDLIEDNKTGYLTATNADSLSAAMASLIDDTTKRKSVGDAARASVQGYTFEAILHLWENLLKN